MDFITDLPESNGCTSIMVITDRLSKGTILVGMESLEAQVLADKFIRHFVRNHGLPDAIVSDRGSQFTGGLWTEVCKTLGIVRRLSTAFHPQTDGATERVNSTLEVYLRIYSSYGQTDWEPLLAIAELALNSRDATSTGVSPFFLSHGYHPRVVDIEGEVLDPIIPSNPRESGQKIVHTIQAATDWAISSMAYAQQSMEAQANKKRGETETYKVGDKVWLNMRNVLTKRKNKKLDWKNYKFTVIEVVSPHSVRLDTPRGIHNVFHTDLLKLADTDSLPSQIRTNPQPEGIQVQGETEWEIEAILDQREKKRRRNARAHTQYLVKWVGYEDPTWEPAEELEQTTALDLWQARLRR